MNILRILSILTMLLTAQQNHAEDITAAVSTNRTDSLTKSHQDTVTIVRRIFDKPARIVRKTIREFDRLNNAYIEPQHYEFTVMGQATNNFESFELASNDQSILMSPDQNIKIGPYFGWRWIFLGYTFQLSNLSLSRKGVKREFDFTLYSSQVGLDLFYRRTGNDYKLRKVQLGGHIDASALEGTEFDGVKVGITGLNAYYIFNHGRFSYPAAFSQSTCQKISCGSWLAGAGFTKNTLDIDFEKLRHIVEEESNLSQAVKLDSGMMFDKLAYTDYSLSLGYAYNWVFAPNWLFCASGQAALAYKTSYGNTANEANGFSFRKVNLDGIGRFSIVYNNTRFYLGTSVILRSNNYHTSRFRANNVFGSMNTYIGYNFKLKRKYRRKT